MNSDSKGTKPKVVVPKSIIQTRHMKNVEKQNLIENDEELDSSLIDFSKKSTKTPRSPVKIDENASTLKKVLNSFGEVFKGFSPPNSQQISSEKDFIKAVENLESGNIEENQENFHKTRQYSDDLESDINLTETTQIIGIEKNSITDDLVLNEQIRDFEISNKIVPIETSSPINLEPKKQSNKMSSELSYALKYALKSIPKITSESSPQTVSVWLNIVKDLARDLSITEHDQFFKLLSISFDDVIKDLVATSNTKTVKDLVILVENHFGPSKNIERGIEEIQHLRKLRSESYARFGARLISRTRRAIEELIKNAHTGTDVKIVVEEVAMRTLRKNLLDSAIASQLGSPTNLMDAVTKITNLEKELYGDITEDFKVLEPEKVELVSFLKVEVNCCQKCDQENHEFLNCPNQDCVYCDDTSHKSVNCQTVPSNLKFVDVCKGCNKKGHSADFCKDCPGNFCQVCQSPNHRANNCNIKIPKFCNKCKSLKHENGIVCPVLLANEIQNVDLQKIQKLNNQNFNQNNNFQGRNFQNIANNTQGNQKQNIQCYKCGQFGHISRNCQQRSFQSKQFYNSNRGFQNNQNQRRYNNWRSNNFNGNHKNNFNNGNFNGFRGQNQNFNNQQFGLFTRNANGQFVPVRQPNQFHQNQFQQNFYPDGNFQTQPLQNIPQMLPQAAPMRQNHLPITNGQGNQ